MKCQQKDCENKATLKCGDGEGNFFYACLKCKRTNIPVRYLYEIKTLGEEDKKND